MKKDECKDIIINNILFEEEQLLVFYINAINKEPRAEDISQSLYLTCITLDTLEQLGNKFPTQEEIDAVEKIFKRFSRRKSLLMPKMKVAA